MGLIPTPLYFMAQPIAYPRFTASLDGGDNDSSIQFNNVPIGQPSPFRTVIISGGQFDGGDDNGTPVIESATIGGVEATIHVNFSGNSNLWIISAVVPTGTTATVVINLSWSTDDMEAYVYTAYNLRSASAFDTGTGSGAKKSGSTACQVDVPDGGFVIAVADGTITSGATLDDDQETYSGAHTLPLPAQTGRTITASIDSSGKIAAASFR